MTVPVHSHQQYTGFYFFHILTNPYFLVIGNRWYLTVILIYISLILSIFSYTCWQLVCIPWKKNVYEGLLPIFSWMVIMIIAIELYQFYTLCILTYSDPWFAHTLLCSIGCLFILLIISFAAQKLFDVV